VLRWVYIPFGSMLIRSMGLVHSGHYGSPGNCRYHATFTAGKTRLDTDNLGYLSQMAPERRCDFSEWGVSWCPTIPEEGRTPDGYRRIKCSRWTAAKTAGTQYRLNYINWFLEHKFGAVYTKNLSPYKGCIPPVGNMTEFYLHGDLDMPGGDQHHALDLVSSGDGDGDGGEEEFTPFATV
jgi:hypothetical protein